MEINWSLFWSLLKMKSSEALIHKGSEKSKSHHSHWARKMRLTKAEQVKRKPTWSFRRQCGFSFYNLLRKYNQNNFLLSNLSFCSILKIFKAISTIIEIKPTTLYIFTATSVKKAAIRAKIETTAGKSQIAAQIDWTENTAYEVVCGVCFYWFSFCSTLGFSFSCTFSPATFGTAA